MPQRVPRVRTRLPKSVQQPLVSMPASLSEESYKAINKLALVRQLHNSLGTTADGKDWAMCALDPCGEVCEHHGLPDTSTASILTPSYKTEVNISYDSTMFETPPVAPGSTYSVQMFIPPIPEIDFIYRVRDDASNTWSKWRVVRLPNFPNVTGSYTVPGVGNISIANAGTTMRSAGMSKYRIVGRGHTLCLNAPDLANQGRIIVGQSENDMMMTDVTLVTNATNVAGAVFTAAHSTAQEYSRAGEDATGRVISYTPPTTEDQVVVSCPRVYQNEAKEGAYIVYKFDGPLQGYQYHNTGDSHYVANHTAANAAWDEVARLDPMSALVLRAVQPGSSLVNVAGTYMLFTSDSIMTVPSPFQPSGVMPVYAAMHPYVSDPCDQLCTSVFFLGIANPAHAGATTGASIRVKGRLYVEGIPNPFNPAVVPYIHPPPVYDPLALETVVKVGQMGMDAYPESYNGFGDMVGSILSTISKIGQPILKLASYIPGVGNIARFGADLLGGVNEFSNAAHAFATI